MSNHNGTPDPSFADRVFFAWRRCEIKMGQTLEQSDVGKWVAELEGRRVAYTQAAVSRWTLGHQPRKLATMAALADVLGVPRAYLAFGGERDPEPVVTVEPSAMRRKSDHSGLRLATPYHGVGAFSGRAD